MAFVLVLSMAGVALANTFIPGSGYAYATDSVNVRSGPDASYSILGYYSRGDKITITGSVSNGWTQVRLPNGMLGYVLSAYLGSAAPSPGYPIVVPSGTVFRVTTAALNIRSGPGTNYGVLGVLRKGDQVTRIGQNGKWFKVATSTGTDAWVSSKYLASVDGGYPVYEDTTTATMYATTGVNVRSGPGTGYGIVGGLNRGDRVTRTGKSGSWTKISWGNGSAYVFSKYLQLVPISGGGSGWTQPPASSYYTRYAMSQLNVRSGPSTSYTLLGSVGQGQALTCVGTDGDWTRILWGSGYAYVYTSYLTSTYYGNVYPGGWDGTWDANVVYGSTDVYMYRSAPLYSSPSTAFQITTLAKGTKVTLMGVQNGWARIMYSNTVYYTPADALAYSK